MEEGETEEEAEEKAEEGGSEATAANDVIVVCIPYAAICHPVTFTQK